MLCLQDRVRSDFLYSNLNTTFYTDTGTNHEKPTMWPWKQKWNYTLQDRVRCPFRMALEAFLPPAMQCYTDTALGGTRRFPGIRRKYYFKSVSAVRSENSIRSNSSTRNATSHHGTPDDDLGNRDKNHTSRPCPFSWMALEAPSSTRDATQLCTGTEYRSYTYLVTKYTRNLHTPSIGD